MIVFDLCEKGAIMKMVSGKEVQGFTEQQALRYFRQLVLAIEYCKLSSFFPVTFSFFFFFSF